MNKFYIFFWGLICHVGKHKNDLTERTHACLVDAPGTHSATLHFGIGDSEPLNSTPAHAVRFKHGNGNATMVPNLDAVLPSLKAILDIGPTDAKPNVYGKGGPHRHVDYPKVTPGGSVVLAPANLYEKEGQHFTTSLKREGVVARLVVAVVNTADTELVLRFNGHENRRLTLESPCLLVANVETTADPHPPCDPNDNHFKLYSQLLDQAPEAIACDAQPHLGQVPFPSECTWVLDVITLRNMHITAATSTECGNTQWP